jgi:uncharacterized protein
MLHPFLTEKLPEITKMFKEHHVKSAYAFGSVVTDKFNEESDVDVIINMEDGIEPAEKGELMWNLWDKLEELFKRKVDMVSENSLTNPYFIEELNEKKQLLYGKTD